ncbi:hypothetical protein DRO69_00040 [Candidatus Bathyarchaeota archaeon]|nr:MAG: hypothetical protein DRO69_00040 [Candidatus Bathyarchaeota archaeon]
MRLLQTKMVTLRKHPLFNNKFFHLSDKSDEVDIINYCTQRKFFSQLHKTNRERENKVIDSMSLHAPQNIKDIVPLISTKKVIKKLLKGRKL